MKVRLHILKEYVFDMLVEGRVEDAQEKYPDMPEEDFDKLVHNQPDGSNNKYLMWSCKQVDDGFSTEVVIQAVRLYNGNVARLEKKDINQYKDVGEVEEAVQKLGASKGEKAKKIKADAEVIHNDERFLVIRPHTAESSCKYGTGTKWCIAATGSTNYYNSYSSSNNKFYFVIDKQGVPNSKNSKFAFAIIDTSTTSGEKIQIYDAADIRVNQSVVSGVVGEQWPEIWKKIQDHVTANPSTREVDEKKKATADHVRALLAGEAVSTTGMDKILVDADLTVPVVTAIIKKYENVPVPVDREGRQNLYGDPRYNVRANFSSRVSSMSPEAALMAIKFVSSLTSSSSDSYYLDRMIENANLPPHAFFELYAAETNNERVLGNIMSNPSAPAALKDQIAARVDGLRDKEVQRKIYMRLIKDGSITPEQMTVAMSDRFSLGANILYNPPAVANLSPDLLRLIPVRSASEFKYLMAIPNVPPDHIANRLMAIWAMDTNRGGFAKYDLIEILKTINLSTALVEEIWSKKKDSAVRLALLQNPSIGAENAATLAKSKNSAYRFAIAHNTVTSAADLDALAKDESVSTRSAVAANTKTSPTTLARLAADDATAVRASVAGNASTSLPILNALKRDSESFIRRVARKTLKSLVATESIIRKMLSMQYMLSEALDASDEDYGDTMSPDWRDIPVDSIKAPTWMAIYLLQNNGSATREDIGDAYEDWRGKPGTHELWATDRNSGRQHRGINAGGKGWWWSPPGVNKGSLFRLTPAGATVAMMTLNKLRGNNLRGYSEQPMGAAGYHSQVGWRQARKGRTYYVSSATNALDATGYENGYLDVISVEANANNEPKRTATDGYIPAGRYYRGPTTTIQRYTPMKENGHPDLNKAVLIQQLPRVNVPKNAEVEFIRAQHPLDVMKDRYSSTQDALVKFNGRSVVVKFPLWVAPDGAQPAAQPAGRRSQPPVKTSAPPAELAPRQPGQQAPAAEPTQAAAAAERPRGPKTTFKVYGKHRGAPAHTRLKGKAYVAAANTRFRPGDQVAIAPEDGKLKVKKPEDDYSQLWEPSEG